MKEKPHVDFLHIWFADGINNMCECEECLKSSPTDQLIQLLNETDEAFTQNGINTRIVFATTDSNSKLENIKMQIENSLLFLDKTFGKSQELYLYLVNILNNVNIIMFISRNKITKFFEYNSLLVNNKKSKEIIKEIENLNEVK